MTPSAALCFKNSNTYFEIRPEVWGWIDVIEAVRINSYFYKSSPLDVRR